MFAFQPIPRGACIIEYTGVPVAEERGRYTFETGPGTMIDGNIPSNRAKYINHSCAPNCEIDINDRRVFVFAKRGIRAGEELTYDYDTEYFEEFIKPVGCRCAKCLPVVG
jgi:SET domain-containing protein